MKIMDNICRVMKSNSIPTSIFILLPGKLVAQVYSDDISKSQLLIIAKEEKKTTSGSVGNQISKAAIRRH